MMERHMMVLHRSYRHMHHYHSHLHMQSGTVPVGKQRVARNESWSLVPGEARTWSL